MNTVDLSHARSTIAVDVRRLRREGLPCTYIARRLGLDVLWVRWLVGLPEDDAAAASTSGRPLADASTGGDV